MNDIAKTKDDTFECIDCKQMVGCADAAVGDVVECEFCGLEYERKEDQDGEKVFEVIEEEK